MGSRMAVLASGCEPKLALAVADSSAPAPAAGVDTSMEGTAGSGAGLGLAPGDYVNSLSWLSVQFGHFLNDRYRCLFRLGYLNITRFFCLRFQSGQHAVLHPLDVFNVAQLLLQCL